MDLNEENIPRTLKRLSTFPVVIKEKIQEDATSLNIDWTLILGKLFKKKNGRSTFCLLPMTRKTNEF